MRVKSQVGTTNSDQPPNTFPGSDLLQIRIANWMYNVHKGEFAKGILLINQFESLISSSWSACLHKELMERLYDKRKKVV
jgi:hypothetical protein